MKVAYRSVRKKDLKRVNEIANQEEVALYLNSILPVTMKSTKQFYELTRKKDKHWHVIIADGIIAGSIFLDQKRQRSKQAHVATLGISIASEYQSMGLGDKAMKYIIRLSKELGVKRLDLEVISENKRAQRLYRKHGFVKEGVKKKAYRQNRKYLDVHVMARILK